MKIRFFSDIHLEFAPYTPPECACDAVVLAGDIGVGESGARWIEKHFPTVPIFYVLGNHEYYDQRLDTLVQRVRDFCHGTGIILLEKDEYILDNVRFLGCSLWTDFAIDGQPQQAMDVLPSIMTDYSVIKIEDHLRKIRPSDILAEHQTARAWLEQKLTTPFAGKTVVITHHAPSSLSLSQTVFSSKPQRRAGYASALEDLIPKATVWFHGHVHTTADYVIGETRVLCNPRGYIPHAANLDFNPYWSIDI